MITVVAIGPVAVTTNYWEEYQEDGTEDDTEENQRRASGQGSQSNLHAWWTFSPKVLALP